MERTLDTATATAVEFGTWHPVTCLAVGLDFTSPYLHERCNYTLLTGLGKNENYRVGQKELYKLFVWKIIQE